jgi:hypothetical protein
MDNTRNVTVHITAHAHRVVQIVSTSPYICNSAAIDEMFLLTPNCSDVKIYMEQTKLRGARQFSFWHTELKSYKI